jgi:hypothetical protein
VNGGFTPKKNVNTEFGFVLRTTLYSTTHNVHRLSAAVHQHKMLRTPHRLIALSHAPSWDSRYLAFSLALLSVAKFILPQVDRGFAGGGVLMVVVF